MRTRASVFSLAALALAAMGPSEAVVPISKPTGIGPAERPRRAPSSSGRRYVAKEGNSAVDNAKRAKAEAKRQRKTQKRRPHSEDAER